MTGDQSLHPGFTANLEMTDSHRASCTRERMTNPPFDMTAEIKRDSVQVFSQLPGTYGKFSMNVYYPSSLLLPSNYGPKDL